MATLDGWYQCIRPMGEEDTVLVIQGRIAVSSTAWLGVGLRFRERRAWLTERGWRIRRLR